MNPRHLIICAGLSVAVLVGGCSDDDDAATTTTAAGAEPSGAADAEFVAAANEICGNGSAEIGQLFGAMGADGEPTPEQMQETLDQLVEISRGQVDDLAALTAPADLADRFDEMLDAASAANDEAESQGLAFFEGDDDPWAEANAIAAELGLDACAGG